VLPTRQLRFMTGQTAFTLEGELVGVGDPAGEILLGDRPIVAANLAIGTTLPTGGFARFPSGVIARTFSKDELDHANVSRCDRPAGSEHRRDRRPPRISRARTLDPPTT
jgi:hypothetical protein